MSSDAPDLILHRGLFTTLDRSNPAAGAVADDDKVRIQRLEVQRGVLERLAFLKRGRLGGEINDVRT